MRLRAFIDNQESQRVRMRKVTVLGVKDYESTIREISEKLEIVTTRIEESAELPGRHPPRVHRFLIRFR